MLHTDRTDWRAAQILEVRRWKKFGVLGPEVDLPPGHTAIPIGWANKTKRNGTKRARGVAMGFLLKSGVHYNQTFSPVIKPTSFRIFLALVAKYDLEVTGIDFSSAFLSADMDTEVYVTLPPGFHEGKGCDPYEPRSKKVRRMLKAVPGIPQGSRLFNKKAHTVITKTDFKALTMDRCLYKHPSSMTLICLHVDDGKIAWPKNKPQAYKKVLGTMQQHFEVNEVEENDFLGMQIHRDRANRRLYLSQRPALVKAIATAMGPDTATEPTPVVVNTKFTKEDTPDAKRPDNWVTKEEAAWYLRSVATMIYFYNHSRPDFGFGISKLCKFMQNPGKCHLKFLKRLFRYGKGTTGHASSSTSPPPDRRRESAGTTTPPMATTSIPSGPPWLTSISSASVHSAGV